MGENSGIEWTHHTFNIVWGCAKVSPACTHCYAEAWAKRTGHDVWGVNAPRKEMSEAYWRQPLRWNREAHHAGERRRVFCSSMADVFEDHPTVARGRERLWPLIEATPWLDWLLLTKRPENINDMAPHHWREPDIRCGPAGRGQAVSPPRNVWLGTTVENQEWYDRRIRHLMAQSWAAVRFLSAEPLLGPLAMDEGFFPNGGGAVDWVIVGGESGGKARPFALGWAESIVSKCRAQKVPVFVKQLGDVTADDEGTISGHRQGLVNIKRGAFGPKGKHFENWPAELRVREFPR